MFEGSGEDGIKERLLDNLRYLVIEKWNFFKILKGTFWLGWRFDDTWLLTSTTYKLSTFSKVSRKSPEAGIFKSSKPGGMFPRLFWILDEKKSLNLFANGTRGKTEGRVCFFLDPRRVLIAANFSFDVSASLSFFSKNLERF